VLGTISVAVWAPFVVTSDIFFFLLRSLCSVDSFRALRPLGALIEFLFYPPDLRPGLHYVAPSGLTSYYSLRLGCIRAPLCGWTPVLYSL
jgi:hypothetical protein